MPQNDYSAKRLEISGLVQGIGFRPFVFQLATRHGIKGQVVNTSAGVHIHIEGPHSRIESFHNELIQHKPALAQITGILDYDEPVRGFRDFSIGQSERGALRTALISADIAVCEDCLRELNDPIDRRYHYPFINCTNCGPRYTIIKDIPYDRPGTTMQVFEMCPACRAEYEDPLNRRFHAQPNACPDCGPHVSLHDAAGREQTVQDAVAETARLLKQGAIVGIKGLGGFHLAVDAVNEEAVARLRRRKDRPHKPLALMALDTDQVRSFARFDAEEEKLLCSRNRPIVLLRKQEPNRLALSIAAGQRCFGVMLPYTPLHYLLLQQGFTALVMTSGNFQSEPIVIDNPEALAGLNSLVDYFLLHNRDIYLRNDDSIARVSSGVPVMIRRSRGYAPAPLFLAQSVPPILACGAEMKNTICLVKDRQAFLSQHIGDLENLSAYEFYQATIRHLKQILDIEPRVIAHDLHPDYLSTRFALEQTEGCKVGVQHHHAHVVSCMTENNLDGPVIGLAFDGTGFGADGCLWGGEILIAEAARFKRIAHLSYTPMPGGAAAIREPWRMALGYLYSALGPDFVSLDLPMVQAIDQEQIALIAAALDRKINTPNTSSLGRLFDGIAALSGIRTRVSYEGQAAMELEMIADEEPGPCYDYEWVEEDCYQIRVPAIIRGVLADLQKGAAAALISAKLHRTVIRVFTELCTLLSREHHLDRVVLSGGVFQNEILLTGLVRALTARNLKVFHHAQVPANDGGIALGQALVAAAVLKEQSPVISLQSPEKTTKDGGLQSDDW